MIGIYLGNKKIKSIYLGNKKIKKIYLGNSLVYQDSAKKDLTLIKMGEVTFNNIYIAPQVSNIDGGSMTLIKLTEV